ncbi:MAG TPA: YncE family protein, partial [Gemmatimonadales bacterium]|nr:YncE family protein [Gemmatimonadales bacterium]
MRIRFGQLARALVFPLVIAACSSDTPVGPPGGGGSNGGSSGEVQLKVLATQVHLKRGEKLDVPITVTDANGNTQPLTGVTFKMRGDLVAGVSDGSISAFEPGADTVLAILGDDTVAVEVVVDFPDGIHHPAGVVAGEKMLGERPFGVAISAGGALLATQLDASSVSRGDAALGAFTDSIPVGAVPTDVTIDSAGTFAYVTNQHSFNVGVIDLATNTEVDSIPIGINTFRVRLTRDGSRLLVTTSGDWMYIIDVATRQITDSVQVGQAANGIALDYTGHYAYISNQVDGAVDVVDLTSDQVVNSFAIGGHPQDVVLSPGSTVMFVADEDGSVQVWSVRENVSRGSIEVPGGAFAMAVSPDWRQ